MMRKSIRALALLVCASLALPAQVTVRNGMSYVGAYSSGSTYAKGDVVLSGGLMYLSLVAANIGHAPGLAASASFWQFAGVSTGSLYAAGGGSANAQTATYTPAFAALTTGQAACWLPVAANTTTTPTFSPNGLTAKTITKLGTAALAAGDLTGTAIACAIYDGTEWQLQNPQTVAAVDLSSSGVINILPIAKGGTGTATPGIVAGTNVTVTGSWPNQTVNSTSGGASNPSTCTASDATNICLTLAPYYAEGTGLTTTTSGTTAPGTSVTLSTTCSASAFDSASAGTTYGHQGVYIAGAGAAGANYIGTVSTCVGSTMTLAVATSTSVATGAVVKHDNTAAFTAAISALSSSGGAIWLPKWNNQAASIYRVNGPLQDTSGSNAVLPMPVIANYLTNPIDITIQGVEIAGGAAASGQVGEYIQTETPSGNFFGGYDSAPGGGWANITNVRLHLANLTLSSYSNPGFVFVNGTNLQGLTLKDVFVAMPSVTTPSNASGAGVLTPRLGNNLDLDYDNVHVAGYYTGMQFGEHSTFGRIYISSGVNCAVFDVGNTAGSGAAGYEGNSISGNYYWTQQCTNAIVGGSHPTTISIQAADLELNTNDVVDSSVNLYGEVNYRNPYSSGNCTIGVSGTTHLRLNPLRCAGQVSQPLLSGNGGSNMIGQSMLSFSSSSSSPANFFNLLGLQAVVSSNTYFNGTNFIRQAANSAGAERILGLSGGKEGWELNLAPTGSAGSTITTFGTTGVIETCTSDNHCMFNPGSETPTYGTNTVLAVNPGTTVDNLATTQISTNATTNKALVLQGKASQSANIFETQDSTGAVKSSIDPSGNLTVASCTGCAAGSSITLKTNGTTNGSQSTLNLAAGTNVTLTDNGSGTVTITSSGGGGTTPTTVVKQGSASGTAYTTTSTTAVAMDATNLSYTVTIPTGSKLLITATFPYDPSTVAIIIGLYDGSTLLGSNGYVGPGTEPTTVTVTAVVTGDGASHTIQAKFSAGSAGTAQIYNQSGLFPQMVFFLTPST